MKGFKMSYSNGMLSESTSFARGKDGKDGLPGVGFKLTPSGDFDLQRKRLTNVAEGTGDSDAVTKHQVDTLKIQLKADSLQIDGSSHMTGDLDLRGNKLINPGEIEMNRKLITNLNTDEDNDLSAVNMITLKKFHPDVPAHTHEVTKDIDLKELFNVIQSKQRSLNELKAHYDSLVSFEEVNENFLSRREEFPMETQLNMNHNSITNLKDPEFGGEAATKSYADGKLALTGGRMTGSINMENNEITNLPTPTGNSNPATKKYVDDIETKLLSDVALELIKKIDIGEIDQKNEKIINLGEPTSAKDAATKDFVEKSHVSQSGLQQNVFLYQMTDDLESSSESNITVTGIKDFPNTPHTLFKKAYHFTIGKNAQNEYNARIGFNFYRVPTGAYTYVVEYFPPFLIDVSVDCRSTPLNVNKQIFKKFPTYVKNIVQIHKWQMATPCYLMIDLKSKGGAATPTRGDGRLIVYGIKGTHNDVSSSVLDAAYVVENGKMVMETDLDLNGKRLLNYNLKSKTVIFGQYGKESETIRINNETDYHVFGFDFTVKKITIHFTVRDGPIVPVNTSVMIKASSKTQSASGVDIGNNAISYSFDFAVAANEEFELSLRNRGGIARANATILIEME